MDYMTQLMPENYKDIEIIIVDDCGKDNNAWITHAGMVAVE